MNMQEIHIPGTEDTPEIKFSAADNSLILSGRSLPEDVTEFYKPLFDWFDNFSQNISAPATFKFRLEYFNTASSKIILDLLMKLEDVNATKPGMVAIEWAYAESDDDMLEAGEEYKELVDVPFSIIPF